MRRYGLSIVFVLLIVISIGTFYIQTTASSYPDFILKKQYGDEKEIEGVSLRGQYFNNRINATINVSSAGTKYMNERSLFGLIDPYYWDNGEVKQIVSEHRQFMRGKRGFNGIYEDDQLLVYAEAKSDDSVSSGVRRFYFEVSVLDKKQNKTWSYEVSVPDGELNRIINVLDVQVFGDEIVVVTSNFNMIDSEYHRYSLGLKSNQIPLDQLIMLPQPQNVEIERSGTVVNFNVQRVYETSITKPSQYNIFYAIQTQTVPESNNMINSNNVSVQLINPVTSQEIVSAQMIVYDLQTGREVKIDSQEVIEFLETQSGTNLMNFDMDGDNVFLTKQSNQGVIVMEYNIPNDKATIHDVQLDDQTDAVIYKVIKNQRLYMLMGDVTDSNQPSLIIVDLNSDKMIYKGTIELNETEQYKTNELNKLSFYHIVVK